MLWAMILLFFVVVILSVSAHERKGGRGALSTHDGAEGRAVHPSHFDPTQT